MVICHVTARDNLYFETPASGLLYAIGLLKKIYPNSTFTSIYQGYSQIEYILKNNVNLKN
jgi:hypothetical protein